MIEYRYKRLFGSNHGGNTLEEVAEKWIDEQVQNGFDLYQLTDGVKPNNGEGFVFITMVRYA